ncbi:MAG: aminopeptidase [Myxococcota bacterium]
MLSGIFRDLSRGLSLAMLFLMLMLSGCYYSHLASGQFKLLWGRQPIAEVIDDPTQSEKVRTLLRLVEPVRHFAKNLGLRVDDQYTSFVDWPGDRIVTSLVRTRPGSLEAVPYSFPILGELPYKGYFNQALAEAEASRFRSEEGFDVCISPIRAYSTLGWFADPVTRPMLALGTAGLVESLFHELVHSTAFLPNAADFNESIAQFIGQQATILFFEEQPYHAEPSPITPERVRNSFADRRAIRRVMLAFRNRLAAIEKDSPQRALRDQLEANARIELAALPLQTFDPKAVAAGARLSNACLALYGTYADDLPRHAKLLNQLEGDLPALIRRLSHWAQTEQPAETFFDVDPGPAHSLKTPLNDPPVQPLHPELSLGK